MSGGESSGSSQSKGFGSSYSQSASLSVPENLTSQSFQNLAPYTAGVLQQLTNTMGSGGANAGIPSSLGVWLNQETGGQDPNGSFVAPLTQQQNDTLAQIGAAQAGNFGLFDNSAAAEQGQLLSEMQNPEGFGQALANGLPVQPGMAAFASDPGAAGIDAANNVYQQLVGTNPQLAQELQPGYAAGLASGQPTRSVIDAALAPIRAQFAGSTAPGVMGQFASAGQRAGGGGSSAFDMAFGNAQAQELANEGAVAGNIVNTVYNTGLNLSGNAATTLANAESGGYGLGYTGSVNENQLLQSEKAGLYGAGVNAGINAPGQLNALNQTTISDLLSSLQAEALPQLTQQLGINNALSQYNTNVSSMLQALGLQVQAEQPSIGYASESASNSASFQNEESSGQQSGFQFSI